MEKQQCRMHKKNCSPYMADIVAPEVRSRMMSRIRSKHTKPELIIRQGLFKRGFRYRLHAKDLPGKPDLAFKSRCAAIQVNGCFWHGHDCNLFRWPGTRKEFWKTKILGNRLNDKKALNALKSRGWRVLTIWECALKGRSRNEIIAIIDQVTDWLENGTETFEIRGKRYAGAQ